MTGTQATGEAPSGSRRSVAIDVIRTTAMVLVVAMHTSDRTCYETPVLYGIVKAAGALGVPFFVMMTGYLMVGRTYDDEYLDRFLRNNLLPLVVALEAWNLLWYLLGKLPFYSNDPITLDNTLRVATFTGDSHNAFWYVPLVVGLYLGMPIFSAAAKWVDAHWNHAYAKVLVGALLYFGSVVPTVHAILAGGLGIDWQLTSVYRMNIFGNAVWGGSVWAIYLAVGFAIRGGHLRRVRTGALVVAGVACFVMLAVYIPVSSWRDMADSAGYDYSFLPTVVAAACIFELTLRGEGRLRRMGERVQALVREGAAVSFGVYMTHLFVWGAVWGFLKLSGLIAFAKSHVLVLIPVYVATVAVVTAVSWAIVRLVGRIPWCRRWLLLMK